jgi:riboflavin synthase
MFTGLIEATGRVDNVQPDGSARRIRIATPIGRELAIGDSVAVNGVCLTVVTVDADGFTAVVSPETLRVTNLGDATPGRVVNLERPVRADGRLGGHFVLGHVDAVGRIARIAPDGECYWLDIDVPASLEALMIPKGSIAVDGISLTVASLSGARVGIQIVPHTWSHTALAHARAGDAVNLEGDMIGKYVARLLAGVQHS